MQTNQPHFIEISQLQVGLYVYLDLGWMDHPFALSNFKLKDEAQISKIKKIGLKKLRYDPARSDCNPLPVQTVVPHATSASVKEADGITSAIANNETTTTISKAERLIQLNHAIDENEKKFIIASDITRQITCNILADPQTSIEQANVMVSDMVDSAFTEGDIVIHAVNGNRSSDINYQHPLNVTVITLIMAKSVGMSKEEVRLLGMAAIFHDIGKAEIANYILTKKEPLTQSELSNLEQHSAIGARMAQEVGLPVRIGKIILQHHEHADGSGYPNHLKAEQIDPLARLVALANGYDNLCNPNDPMLAKTPYEALAHMYAHQRTIFDESFLKHLIKSLGIYPPGSIVQLSTGEHAIVISANPNKPLRPYVMVHDPLADRQNPKILDLRKVPNININSCMRANQLPPEAFNYLNPRSKISYFIDANPLNGEDELN